MLGLAKPRHRAGSGRLAGPVARLIFLVLIFQPSLPVGLRLSQEPVGECSCQLCVASTREDKLGNCGAHHVCVPDSPGGGDHAGASSLVCVVPQQLADGVLPNDRGVSMPKPRFCAAGCAPEASADSAAGGELGGFCRDISVAMLTTAGIKSGEEVDVACVIAALEGDGRSGTTRPIIVPIRHEGGIDIAAQSDVVNTDLELRQRSLLY